MACLDGLVSVGLLAVAGFLYGYVDGTIHAWQIQIALAVLVQAISLAGAFELQVFLEQGKLLVRLNLKEDVKSSKSTLQGKNNVG